MYYTEYKPSIVPITDLLCFSNLLTRWSHDAPGKLFYKINNNFFLYEAEEMFKSTDGSVLMKMRKHTDNRNKFDYYIEKYEYLFFLINEIESIEKDNPAISLIPANIPENDNDILCTGDNIGIIAPKAINAICVQDEYCILSDNECDTYKVDGKIRFGTRGVVLQPEKLWPKIPHVRQAATLNMKRTQLYEIAAEYMASLRALGQTNIKILAKQTKEMYPKLIDASLGRLISPPGEEKKCNDTYRQRARRALGKVP